MSAPTQTPPPNRSASRTTQNRTRTEPRPRSAAAARAYARRAQRTQNSEKLLHRGPAPVRTARPAAPAVARKRTRIATGQASTASFVVLLIGLLIVGVGATLWLSTQATADSYKLENLKDTTTQLAQQRGQLKAQVDEANSATSLANRAKQLGMVPAVDPAHLVVNEHGKVKVIGKPKPAEGPAPGADGHPQPPQQPQQPPQQPPNQQRSQQVQTVQQGNSGR